MLRRGGRGGGVIMLKVTLGWAFGLNLRDSLKLRGLLALQRVMQGLLLMSFSNAFTATLLCQEPVAWGDRFAYRSFVGNVAIERLTPPYT